ncbi:MAG: hypothetical protein KVP17_005067 [Porospora cf. gigantea B]|uniref:uncharacterized protein n=2 Tax=Porospora cf. gigantea B TaxID=2853592 RepID=UPI003571E482|nr:MAG: hypothetical protein KVP17_005067 [Porospora cf. gigantea B]
MDMINLVLQSVGTYILEGAASSASASSCAALESSLQQLSQSDLEMVENLFETLVGSVPGVSNELRRVSPLLLQSDDILSALHAMAMRDPEPPILPARASPVFISSAQARRDLTCGICLECWHPSPLATSCRHVFCQTCIVHWLVSKSSCPICRAPLFHRDLQQPNDWTDAALLRLLSSWKRLKVKCPKCFEECKMKRWQKHNCQAQPDKRSAQRRETESLMHRGRSGRPTSSAATVEESFEGVILWSTRHLACRSAHAAYVVEHRMENETGAVGGVLLGRMCRHHQIVLPFSAEGSSTKYLSIDWNVNGLTWSGGDVFPHLRMTAESIGKFKPELASEALVEWLQRTKTEGRKYNVISWNCQHFCSSVLRLGGLPTACVPDQRIPITRPVSYNPELIQWLQAPGLDVPDPARQAPPTTDGFRKTIKRIAGRFVLWRESSDMPAMEEEEEDVVLDGDGHDSVFTSIGLVLYPTEDRNRQHILQFGRRRGADVVRASTLPILLLQTTQGYLSIEFRADSGLCWHWYEDLPSSLTSPFEDNSFGRILTHGVSDFNSATLLAFLREVSHCQYEPSSWSGWEFCEALLESCAPSSRDEVLEISDTHRHRIQTWSVSGG